MSASSARNRRTIRRKLLTHVMRSLIYEDWKERNGKMNHQPLTVMLDRQAHRYAQQFAREQITPEKGKQVYLNTLAVSAVNNYLKCFSIATNLAQSNCWHPGMRAMFNVADLTLSQFGKLECLGILPQQTTVVIPPEAREDRIGYLVTRFQEQLQQVELLGFIPSQMVDFTTETINVNQLQSLDALFDTLESLQKQINLRQWFNGLFTIDWQPLESIMVGRMVRSLTEQEPELIAIARGKEISWKHEDSEQKIILIVKITKPKEVPSFPKETETNESASEAINCYLQLYSDGDNQSLPTGLTVRVLDATKEVCLSAIAQDRDDWMQLEFTCQSAEEFTIEVNLDANFQETLHFC
jgi:Protein of unknown function (DUF1822)